MYVLELFGFLNVTRMYPHVCPSSVCVCFYDVYVNSTWHKVCKKNGLVDKLGLCVRVLEVYVDTADVCEEMGGSCFTFFDFPSLFHFSSLLSLLFPLFPSLLFSFLFFSFLFFSSLLFSSLIFSSLVLSCLVFSSLVFSSLLFSSILLSSLLLSSHLFSSLLFSSLFV